MTVLSHLRNTSINAVLNGSEKNSINTSITTLERRLGYYFKSGKISSKFKFGSSTRGTILPRNMDSCSDIDYMIVFSNSNYQPTTYLSWLRKFVSYYYSSSEIYQSSPTIVLELSHIKFDLVPAIHYWPAYQIPAAASDYSKWVSTDPNDFNQLLTNKNTTHKSLIKPLVRLIKYWNALNGYVFESYSLEKKIINMSFWSCYDLKEYFYETVNNLEVGYYDAQWKKNKINRAKRIVNQTKKLEADAMPISAETEIKKLIPKI